MAANMVFPSPAISAQMPLDNSGEIDPIESNNQKLVLTRL